MFKQTSRVHSYNVQGDSINVFVPRPPPEAAKRALATGGQSWNGLENEL